MAGQPVWRRIAQDDPSSACARCANLALVIILLCCSPHIRPDQSSSGTETQQLFRKGRWLGDEVTTSTHFAFCRPPVGTALVGINIAPAKPIVSRGIPVGFSNRYRGELRV